MLSTQCRILHSHVVQQIFSISVDCRFSCSEASDVANFDGSSGLIYGLSMWPSWSEKDVISLKFKTLKNSGMLLHAEGQGDQSLTLMLENGQLLLYHQQGAPSISIYIR